MSHFSFCLLACLFLFSGVLAGSSEPSSSECDLVDISGIDKADLLGVSWYFLYVIQQGNYREIHTPFTRKEAYAAAKGNIEYFHGVSMDIDLSGDYVCAKGYSSFFDLEFFKFVVKTTRENGYWLHIGFKRESDLVNISGLDKADLLLSLWLGGLRDTTTYFKSGGFFSRQEALDAVKDEIDRFDTVFIVADLRQDLVDCTQYDNEHGYGRFLEIVEDQPRKIAENYTHYFRYKKPDSPPNLTKGIAIFMFFIWSTSLAAAVVDFFSVTRAFGYRK